MKHSLLLVGKNKATIDDFFNQLNLEFALISCSMRYEDMDNHLELCKPDLFVICLGGEEQSELKRFAELYHKLVKKEIKIVFVGSEAECTAFSAATEIPADFTVLKPITIMEIGVKLSVYLKNLEKSKELAAQEEAKRLEELKAAEATKLEEANQNRRKHILVVDDEPIMLKTIQEQLIENYDVATAISGKIALKFLEKKGTDLILLDYEMPVENGAEIMAKIRENPQYDNIPIIFLTGVTDREKIRQVLALKPQGYILKPIDREKLLTTIAQHI